MFDPAKAPVQGSTSATGFCPRCGERAAADNDLCTRCGQHLRAQASEVVGCTGSSVTHGAEAGYSFRSCAFFGFLYAALFLGAISFVYCVLPKILGINVTWVGFW